jgi:PadR family transcriptional regulator PadR
MPMADKLPVAKGMLDVLVLRALRWAPMHGFEITEWLEQRSKQRIGLEDAAVYQALYRLEERGLIRASWGTTDNNRRARYYKLTKAGVEQLQTETERWLSYNQAIAAVLAPDRGR